MRPYILLCTLIFLIYCCNDARQGKVYLQDTLKTNPSSIKHLDTTTKNSTDTIKKATTTPDTSPNILFGKMILVSSGQTLPYTRIKINDCNFDLVKRNNDTIYLATNDKKFQTPEGYKVGTEFSELPNYIQKEFIKEPGWGYYYKLSSGWNLGFCEGSSCTDSYPKKISKVKWIFKRQ